MVDRDQTVNETQQDSLIPNSIEFDTIAECCYQSHVGKLLPDAFYIHISALSSLDLILQNYEAKARTFVSNIQGVNIVKFSTSKPKISYLCYPDFDTHAHPALQASIQVDIQTGEVNYRDYSDSPNPPILHRKETFVTPEYPLYDEFTALTQAQESLGLLNNTRGIGTREGWEQRLQIYGIEIQGHQLIQSDAVIKITPKIERHRAAMIRHDLSRPVRLALDIGLFNPETSFFDYGCGHGGDISRIADQGYTASGWDPYYAPLVTADIVNIGFVINVIEDQQERREALIKAWELTQKVLLVAAQVLISDVRRGVVSYGDGIITRRNTFQKYYEQEELKVYIDQVLGVDSIPVALGVYFIFRDETEAELFRASHYRSHATTPRIRASVRKFVEFESLLTPLINFLTERGRLPIKGELAEEKEICAEFISLRRAFHVIRQATDCEEWEAIADRRRQDLLVYLALFNFSHRPRLSKLPTAIKEDIIALYSSYRQACIDADQMLISVGNTALIIKRCQESKVGKKLTNSFWVHISALQNLDPLLRLYEGCVSRTIGRLEDTNVIKFHFQSPKISYLYYPDFGRDAHPTLAKVMTVDLRDLQVTYHEYDIDDDPPILHQIDKLVNSNYFQYEEMVKLTQKEEDLGLFDNWQNITHLSGWRKCLKDNHIVIKGYRIGWCADVDPDTLTMLKIALKKRQKHRKHQEEKDQKNESV
jgi:DNA phosphorothioation-associated putative methyltransferase